MGQFTVFRRIRAILGHMTATEQLPPSRLMGITEAARALGVPIQMVRDLVDKGALRAYRLPSGHRRVPVEAIEEFKIRWLAAPQKTEATDR